MPTGVPISVATVAIIRLPAMALSNPPSLPGGGVFCVNNDGARALKPSWNSVINIQVSQNNPNASARPDINSSTALTTRRRR